MHLLEAHLHRPARVNLQPEDATPGNRRVVQIDARLAVDEGLHVATRRYHFVLVPLVRFDERFARLAPDQAAAVLLVKFAPPALADVGLRSAHLAVGQRFAAELDAAVALVGHQLDLDLQPEIGGDELALQELIARNAGTAADDLA